MSLFNITRRVPNVVDMSIDQFRANFPTPTDPVLLAEQYAIEFAVNWDSPYNPVLYQGSALVLTLNGLRTENVNPFQGSTGGGGAEFRNKIRFLYNPSDLGLLDTDIHFLRVVPIIRGVPQTPGQPLMVLPTELYRGPYLPLVLSGTPAAPVTIKLPRTCSATQIRVLSGSITLYLGTTQFPITLTSGTSFDSFSAENLSVTSLTLDGGGDVEMSFALGPKASN
jgi:hypothetical protein